MRTNIEIDDELMEEAQKLSNIKTKKDIVGKALELFVLIENQKKIATLKGKIKLDDKAFE